MSEADHWDDRYRRADTPWDTGKPSPELMRVIMEEKIEPCRALELGCGTGTNSIWLAQQGFDVTGVDISNLAIQKARDFSAKAPVRFVQGDINHLPPLGEPFPFFFDRGCYHVVRRTGVEGYLKAVANMTSQMARGLVLTGNANRPKEETGPPVVTEEEIRNELDQIFEIVWIRGFRFDPRAGSGDNFLGWSCFVKKKGAPAVS